MSKTCNNTFRGDAPPSGGVTPREEDENMNFFQTMSRKLGAVLEKAKWLHLSRLPLPRSWPREIARAAAAGTILFGIAGAGLGARGGFSTFRVDAASAGATVSVGWGAAWLVWAAAGMACGALAGGIAGYLAHWGLRQRGAGYALMGVGVVGGVLAGATWGSAVARERVVHVRAQPTSAAPITPSDGPTVSIVTGPVRLSGSVDRDFNVPLLAFMLLGGSVVGALAARGLGETARLSEPEENPIDRAGFSQPPRQRVASSRAPAGAF
jgi:hypothetical protein